MEKTLFILLILIPFLFNSCSDDDDGFEPDKLVGRSFAAHAGLVEGTDQYWVFKFTSNTELEWTIRNKNPDGLITMKANGTFGIGGNSINFFLAGNEYRGEIIDNNRFRIELNSYSILEFIRQ